MATTKEVEALVQRHRQLVRDNSDEDGCLLQEEETRGVLAAWLLDQALDCSKVEDLLEEGSTEDLYKKYLADVRSMSTEEFYELAVIAIKEFK